MCVCYHADTGGSLQIGQHKVQTQIKFTIIIIAVEYVWILILKCFTCTSFAFHKGNIVVLDLHGKELGVL